MISVLTRNRLYTVGKVDDNEVQVGYGPDHTGLSLWLVANLTRAVVWSPMHKRHRKFCMNTNYVAWLELKEAVCGG